MTATVTPGAVSAQDPSPEAAYRQSLMQAFRLHMGAIRAATGGSAPLGHAEHHAVAFQQMAVALANAFPEGSGGPGSRALPAIWEDRMDFMNKISAIQSASAELVTAAGSGDAERIGTAAAAVQATCGACHTPYRAS
jgi:cytochrome c556